MSFRLDWLYGCSHVCGRYVFMCVCACVHVLGGHGQYRMSSSVLLPSVFGTRSLTEPGAPWFSKAVCLISSREASLLVSIYTAPSNWHKNRRFDQWNRLKDPDISSCAYSHLNFDAGAKKYYRRKDNIFKWCLGRGLSACRMKFDPSLSLCT